MKKITAILLLMLCMIVATTQRVAAQNAAQARKVLDKAAAVVGNKSGASANFKITSAKFGNTQGTISIKGNKFCANTPQATMWYNGKTQWTLMKQTDEVNVSNPSEKQQAALNPYAFINMYKKGFNLAMTTKTTVYSVHLTAQNAKRSVQEMYILVNKKTYVPTQVKIKQGGNWTTINISNFKAKTLSDNIFTFNAKDYPSAEVIDLR